MSRLSIIGFIIALMAIAAFGCAGASSTAQQTTADRLKVQASQTANQARAEAAYPLPLMDAFATRRNVVRWTEEVNQINTWHIYVYNDTVPVPILHIVADSPTTPYCAFLGAPEQKIVLGQGGYNNETLVQAPGTDGVYWGQGDCFDFQYSWDELSDAMFQVKGFNLIMLNAPMDIDVPIMRIKLDADTPLEVPAPTN